MFSYLNTVSIPIIVTDKNNKVLFKNIVAGKSFTGVRLNSYMSSYFMYKSDAETLDSFCDENIPIVLTMTLFGYTLCCLVTQKVIDGEIYRFYTVAPFMYELFEKRTDDEENLKFLKDYEENILSYVRYMNDRLEGKEENIAAQLKGRIRASARRILYYGDKLRHCLGVPDETISRNHNFRRIVNIYDSVKTLTDCFNNVSKSDTQFKLEYLAVSSKIEIKVNTVVLGRLFTYMAFLNLKYCFRSPEVTVTQKDNSVFINFSIGTTVQNDTELFEIDFSYLKAYAKRNGITVGIDSFSRKSVMYIRLDIFRSDNTTLLRNPIEPYEDYLPAIRRYYDEISDFFSSLDIKEDAHLDNN